MTQLDAIPASSISWLIGAAGALVFGFKSLIRYRSSRTELTRYTTAFSLTIGAALSVFGLPSLFTLNPHTLFYFDLTGEAFIYLSLVFEAAIVWCLILRSYLSIYWLTVPTGLIGAAAWVYALPHATLQFDKDVITGTNPTPTSWATAFLLVALFVPVGVYFLRQAPRQSNFKGALRSAIVGLVYLGTGLIGGGFIVVTGELMTPTSVVGLDIFFTILLVAALWPHSSP